MENSGKLLAGQGDFAAARHAQTIEDLWPDALPRPRTDDPPKEWKRFALAVGDAEPARIFWAWFNSATASAPNILATPQIYRQFLSLWEAGLAYEPPRDASDSTFEDIDADASPVEWLIDGILPARQFGVLYGPPFAGKTFCALSICLCVATGREWFGVKVKQGRVLYVLGEGARQAFRARYRAWLETIPKAEREHVRQLVRENFKLYPRPVALTDPESRAAFLDSLQGFDLTTIDSVLRNIGDGNISDAGAMSRFVQAVDMIRLETGGAVLAIHHSGKDLSRGLLGSVALDAAADAVALFTRTAGDRRIFAVDRLRDAPETMPRKVFTLRDMGESAVLVETADRMADADRLLMAVSKAGPGATVRALADMSGLSKSAVGRHLKNLETAGLVNSDGITPAGRNALDMLLGSEG